MELVQLIEPDGTPSLVTTEAMAKCFIIEHPGWTKRAVEESEYRPTPCPGPRFEEVKA